jgi:signal transduction histidine kinase
LTGIRATGNLLDNAIKFTPTGGRVTLSLGEDESWAWIAVTDTGIGIEEADQALIFNRFYRGLNAAEYAGSGLGLAITHSIVEAHGGRIEVSSKPGRTRTKLHFHKSTL